MQLASLNFNSVTTFIVEYFGIRSVWDIFRIIIDILMISYVFYLLITLLRDSRAFQLIKGVILILLAAFVSDLLRLSTVSFVFWRGSAKVRSGNFSRQVIRTLRIPVS